MILWSVGANTYRKPENFFYLQLGFLRASQVNYVLRLWLSKVDFYNLGLTCWRFNVLKNNYLRIQGKPKNCIRLVRPKTDGGQFDPPKVFQKCIF